MNKVAILKRINGLNEFMLSNSNKQILLLKIPNIYTCNKAIAIVDRNIKEKDWYSVDNKSCFKRQVVRILRKCRKSEYRHCRKQHDETKQQT